MPGKIITITQQKGGSGKTTLAAHLAVALRQYHGLSVAALDTDPQGSLGRWLMVRYERMGWEDEPDIALRTASAWGARYEARQLAKQFDVVIIDMPPKIGGDGRPAIDAADLVLVPVAASPVDLWATEPTIEMVQSEKKELRIVLNKVNARAKITSEISEALGELDVIATDTNLGNRVLFASSMGEGLTASEKEKNSTAGKEIEALTAEVAKILQSL